MAGSCDFSYRCCAREGGIGGPPMEYDEDIELTQYVWENYTEFMTEFERRVGWVIISRTKAASTRSPRISEMIERHWCQRDDVEVNAALADGADAFRRRVRDRVLADHGVRMLINRCQRCGRIVRTPKAQQCFWCGYDWHQESDSVDDHSSQ